MKKLKMGIVGLGRLGRSHALNIANRVHNGELVAVCSIRPEEIEDIKKFCDVPYSYTDYDEMLKNREMDAVFVSSSSSLHCEHIEKALDAGFHVLSEKPLGVSADEVERVEKAVNKHPDKYFMLGFMRRFDRSYAYAKEMVDKGAIGKPFMIRCYGLDPDANALKIIPFLKTSGGLFFDMASHDIDLARWFLQKEAVSVYAIGGCYKYKEYAGENDIDNGVALIKFEDDLVCILYVSRTCAHGNHVETEIIGTKGSLRVANVPEKNLTTVFNEHGVVRECPNGFYERFEEAYEKELQYFVDCVLSGERPAVGVLEGKRAMEISEALKRSVKTGESVKVEIN
jgi:myo-inositol 2-dehydrogenase/D-chiro-inositol 1-dehydrogenase